MFFFYSLVTIPASRVSRPCPLDTISYIIYAYTSNPHITHNCIQLPLFRSSSSFFNIHFYNRSHSFRFLYPHYTTKPSKHNILFHLNHDQRYFYCFLLYIDFLYYLLLSPYDFRRPQTTSFR